MARRGGPCGRGRNYTEADERADRQSNRREGAARFAGSGTATTRDNDRCGRERSEEDPGAEEEAVPAPEGPVEHAPAERDHDDRYPDANRKPARSLDRRRFDLTVRGRRGWHEQRQGDVGEHSEAADQDGDRKRDTHDHGIDPEVASETAGDAGDDAIVASAQ